MATRCKRSGRYWGFSTRSWFGASAKTSLTGIVHVLSASSLRLKRHPHQSRYIHQTEETTEHAYVRCVIFLSDIKQEKSLNTTMNRNLIQNQKHVNKLHW